MVATAPIAHPFVFVPAAAQPAPLVAPILTTPEAEDTWTYAEPEKARVTHVALDLDVDFGSQTMAGTARLNVRAVPGTDEIVLDHGGFEISSITNEQGRALKYTVGKADEARGAPLTIQLGGAETLVIAYRTKPGASALQWLPPEMTAGKQQPFLYSQGQAINNRSWVPTQDSPGVRQTWEASLTVPANLVAVMSGEKLSGGKGEKVSGGKRRFRFRMDKPVPPYLIAFAVGDLEFRSLGPRSGVWAEAPTLAGAADEFADVEKMIDAAIALYGPYRWGRYDMLVLPPAFPYGGMENPMLTFLTPTIITGDRSNTDVVAHELAHSWSGNLVTYATWMDGWINEGVTTYIENRIMERVYGKERAAIYADTDWDTLQREIAAAGGQTGAATRLHGDPGAGEVDYTKGSNFLRMLETNIGREKFDAWLRGYFDRYAFQPMTAEKFLTDLRAHLLNDDPALELQLQLDRWVYAAGLPDNAVHIESETLGKIDEQVAAYAAGGPAADVDTRGWTTQQWLRFLRGIPQKQSAERLAGLDTSLGLSKSGNAYVQSAWLEIAIANRYDPAVPVLANYVGRVGRGLLIYPLYRGLMAQGEWGEPIARRIYESASDTYHPTTARTIASMIEGDAE
jgi:leukotriene-A4 hydrolase